MKRSFKLIRNILLIVIMVSIIGFTKQFRLTPVDVAKVFGEIIFLKNPDIKQLSTNNQYTTFILEEDDVIACILVEKEYGFVYHPADFGSTFITLNNSDSDIESFTSKCSTTFERYFNVSYQDKLKLGNILESKLHNYNYLKPIQIYQVKDTFAYQFYSEFETFDANLDMNYQEYLDNPAMHKVSFYYNDLTKSISSKISEISNQSSYIIERIDMNGNSNRFDFYFEYRLNNPQLLTVSDVLEIENQLHELSIFDESFAQFETIEELEALSENRIMAILNQTVRNLNIDIEVNKVGIYGTSTSENRDIDEKSSLEYYLEYNKLSSAIDRNDLSYDDIKELTLNQALNDIDDYEVLIKTSDDKYIHLDTYSYMEFGPTVITSDGNQIQTYFKISSEEEFDSLITSRPYLDEIIEQIILESYTEIIILDDIENVAQTIHQALVDNLNLNYYIVSVSIIGETIIE